jgi:hypothetical protein
LITEILKYRELGYTWDEIAALTGMELTGNALRKRIARATMKTLPDVEDIKYDDFDFEY